MEFPELEAFLKHLKKTYPLPKRKLCVYFKEATGLPCMIPGLQSENGSAGHYYPLAPTRKLPYHGFITIAALRSDALTHLAHEYRHAMQDAQGLITSSYQHELEIDATVFAREEVKRYAARTTRGTHDITGL